MASLRYYFLKTTESSLVGKGVGVGGKPRRASHARWLAQANTYMILQVKEAV